MKKSIDERLDEELFTAEDLISKFNNPAEDDEERILNTRRERGLSARVEIKSNPEEGDLDDDYSYVRSNLYNLIDRGNDALEGILELAKEMEHPRAYEVASTLIKNVSETSMELLKMQKELQAMRNVSGSDPAGTVNNNMFVGSTADLQKLLRGEKSVDDV